MAIIKPFKALRPQAQLAKQVASRPYDVLNSAEAKVEAQGNPSSFLHITKSEIDLPESTDIHAAEVYEQAKSNLAAFIKRDVLFRDIKECYYIYQLIMNGRSQTGLVCVSSIDDYENNVIRKHEFTRPEKEQDRINHIKVSGAQTGNVFLAYRNNNEVDALIDKWKETKTAVYDFTADDEIRHTIWIVNDSDTIEKITSLFEKEIPCTYIADGHHRAASAAKVRAALGDKATPDADFFLTTLFPSNQLHIMDYNRVVKDLNGLDTEAFLEKLRDKFELTLLGKEAYRPEQLHSFGLYVAGNWYRLVAKPGTYTEDPIGILDVTILQNNILTPILKIEDPRTDKRIDFVGGIRGLAELEKRVGSSDMAAAFSLYPVTIEQLFDISDSGNVMPPKSTWFEPKLRDGLLTHLIYE
ncbi:DUF1015 domain-containing protein [Sediminibacterium ginsengisoli]|uniref:Uncharacterized conserved protein, DUF1015 family n=1 Tax=Sediminibacterium ginsengisoli TaxID=413434 RepID=A0A1T4RH12_9BACT|nr:DUF1015 family protein [Sediminibacterium ginsengisoli]SKA15187.1 Uncharacterized conserved protein, DUF1015 family [Sediminibacterium ginsengisoli]